MDNGRRKVQGCIIGEGINGPSRPSTFYCRDCGHLGVPCRHLDGYLKSQQRDQDLKRIHDHKSR